MPKQLVKFTIFLVLIILSTSLNAQVDTTKADKGVNITFFNGYAIAYKWNANQSMSYRVYLSLYSGLRTGDYDTEQTSDEELTRTGYATRDNKSINMDLSFQFLFNIISQKSFNFYAGIGPNLNFSFSDWESIEDHGNDDNYYKYEYSSSRDTYGIGATALLGIEAHIAENVTLFAESHVRGQRFWEIENHSSESIQTNNEDTHTYKNMSTSDGSGWSANLQLVKVGLGIYF